MEFLNIKQINQLTINAYLNEVERYEADFKDVVADSSYVQYLLNQVDAGIPDNALICDVGCGPTSAHGQFLIDKGHDLVGIDICPRCIEKAQSNNPSMKCVVGDGRLSLFDDGRFDAILAMHVLDHTPKARAYQFFRSFSSMLKPGGKLLVEGYRGQEDGIFKDGWWNDTAVYRSSFLEREWKSIAEEYGFTIDLIDKAPIADQYGMINLYMLCTKK